MGLPFPRDPVLRAYLIDRWRDLSADIRQAPPIRIDYGRKDESAKSSPSKCAFTLDDGPDHGDGDYNPLNPMGQWHEYLSRNVPVHLLLAYGDDQFTRTSASGWGTSPSMGAWDTFVSAGTVASDISSNAGRHSVTSTTAFIASYLPDVSLKTVDAYVEARTESALTVTGGNVEIANLLLRGQNTTTYYMLRIELSTVGTIRMKLMVGSSQVLYDAGTVAVWWGTTDPMAVRFQADGNTFRGKVWHRDSGEPLNWDLEYSHGDVHDAGWVGIRTGLATGNANTKPVRILYDNFRIEIPRFAGEIAKMTPLAEADHTNQRTEVEAAGVLRRLQRQRKTLKTAFERWIANPGPFDPVEYYPLDQDADAADRGQSAISSRVAQYASVSATRGAIKWGEEVKRLGVDRAVTLKSGGILSLDVSSKQGIAEYAQTIAWTWTMNLSASHEAGMFMFLTNGDFFHFQFGLNGAQTVTYYTVSGTPVVEFVAQTPTIWRNDDNQWLNMGFSVERDLGSGIDTLLFQTSNTNGTTTRIRDVSGSGVIVGQPREWVFISNDSDASYQLSIAHCATFANDLFYTVEGVGLDAAVRGALEGWAGERAGERFARLCEEEGTSYGLDGYTTDSPTMGGQGRKPFPALIQESSDVSDGAIFDARGSRAVVLRNTASMYNQQSRLTLFYDNEEVYPDFRPVTDDQGTLNDVTTKRPYGAEFRYQKLTGSLNVQEPGGEPDAVGVYDETVTVNVLSDSQLGDQASWRVAKGTLAGPRFANLTANLGAVTVINGDKDIQALDVVVGDFITITNLDAARIYDDVRLVVWGYTEVLDTAYRHIIIFNTSPAQIYDVVVLDSSTNGRIDSGTTTLNEALTTTETDVTVAVSDSGDLWVTSGATPFDIIVGGERMTVTAVSGATSPQTFTVTRSVNGVVKEHSTGAKVRLFKPARLALSNS